MTRAALVAALYFVLTLVSGIFGLDKGIIQFRLSEMLCILPALIPEAIIGLTVGCFLSNLILGGFFFDIIFGTLATLLGAAGTSLLFRFIVLKAERTAFILPLPTIISNALIIPLVLKFSYGADGAYWFFLLTVALGELVCAGILGTVLYYSLKNSKIKF